MKKIAVCFGGYVEMYTEKLKVREIILKIKGIEKTQNPNIFEYRKNMSETYEIGFFYSYGMTQKSIGKMIELMKKIVTNEKRTYPLPANEEKDMINEFDPDVVLFFGVAGAISNDLKLKNVIHPTKFSTFLFKDSEFIDKQTKQITNNSIIKINNICKKIFERERQNLTLNVSFNPTSCGPNYNPKFATKEDKIKLGKFMDENESLLNKSEKLLEGYDKFRKICDIRFKKIINKLHSLKISSIEADSYYYAQNFSNKKIGISFVISDQPGKIDYNEKNFINSDVFEKEFLRCIKIALKL